MSDQQKTKIKCENPMCDAIVDIKDKPTRDIAKNEILFAVIKCKQCGWPNFILKRKVDGINKF